MRSIATAAAFAIAASLAAGQEPGKSGKSGTKSSKSGDCTDCSADTLTRSNMLTNLFYSNYGEDGVINQASVEVYCAADNATQAEFVEAVDNTIGIFVEGQLFVDALFGAAAIGLNFTEGSFQANIIGNSLCVAEEVGLQCTDAPTDEPIPDACDVLGGSVVIPIRRALQADQFEQPSDMKSYFKSLLNLNWTIF